MHCSGLAVLHIGPLLLDGDLVDHCFCLSEDDVADDWHLHVVQLGDVDVGLTGGKELLDYCVVQLWDGDEGLGGGSLLSHLHVYDHGQVDLVLHGDTLQSVHWSLHGEGEVAHIRLIHVDVVDNG